jgi:type IV secretory pathway VirD2 relaxase
VGHIALSFKPEDAPRLTDAFMARLAEEYLELMGIRNTQFIVVRHHGTDNPHCHIVFNRVNFDGKVISDSNDFKRNEGDENAQGQVFAHLFRRQTVR